MDHRALLTRTAAELKETRRDLSDAKDRIFELEAAAADASVDRGYFQPIDNSTYADATAEVETLRFELKSRDDHIVHLEDTVESLRADKDDHVAHLEETVESLRSEAVALQDQASQAQDSEREVRTRLAELEEDHRRCAEDVRLAGECAQVLQEPDAVSKEQHDRLLAELEKREVTVKRLQEDLAKSQSKHDILLARSQSQKSSTQLQQDLQKAYEKHASNQKLLDFRKDEISQLQAKVKVHEQEQAKLEKRLRWSRDEVGKLRKEAKEREERDATHHLPFRGTPAALGGEEEQKAQTIEAGRLQTREKAVLYLCHRLQKGFLSPDQAPQENEMAFMADFLTQLEAYGDLESSIISTTKIHKVMEAIVKLSSIPKDAQFQFKKRSSALLERWNGAPPSSSSQAIKRKPGPNRFHLSPNKRAKKACDDDDDEEPAGEGRVGDNIKVSPSKKKP